MAMQPLIAIAIAISKLRFVSSQRLLRHVRHKRLGKPQATRTPKRTEPALTVG